MNYPDLFNTIETIKLQDPLSNFLGTFEKGIIEFTYLDIVKNTGHSCPTVAGAYLCAREGLKALYPNELPQRGNIKIEFSESPTEGVAGVIASVISNITGATTNYGFKGINGNFNRTNLMFFNQKVKANVRFNRLNTNQIVEVFYNPNSIPPQKQQQFLMQKIMQGIATPEEKKLFGELWQDRVKRIFDAYEDVVTIVSLSSSPTEMHI